MLSILERNRIKHRDHSSMQSGGARGRDGVYRCENSPGVPFSRYEESEQGMCPL